MNADNNSRQGVFILLIICIALFFSVLNASALGVMLSDIAADLSVDTGQLGWIMTGFLLVFGIAIPCYGRLGDRYGAKPLFILGLSIFPIGSLVCALAPSFEVLLLGQIIQAGGGAAVPGLGMTLASPKPMARIREGKPWAFWPPPSAPALPWARCWEACCQRLWVGNPFSLSTPERFCWFPGCADFARSRTALRRQPGLLGRGGVGNGNCWRVAGAVGGSAVGLAFADGSGGRRNLWPGLAGAVVPPAQSRFALHTPGISAQPPVCLAARRQLYRDGG